MDDRYIRVSSINWEDSDKGNTFVPRLWTERLDDFSVTCILRVTSYTVSHPYSTTTIFTVIFVLNS